LSGPGPRFAPPPLGALAPTATELAEALASGHSTPSAVLEEHLAIIDAWEGEVRAWTYLDREGARIRARGLDRTGDRGPMHGIPFGIKDNIDTADMPTSYGSEIHAGHVPARDAACVACLRLAGANPLGKTVCTEFAHVAPGATRNPWNPAHTPGGSSSGSAAAVASGMVPVAFGSQTTGSVIRPAAYCGVVGYKPTYGDFNVAGMLANTPSFDTLGVMTRCVADLVLVRRAVLDASIPDLGIASLRGARVGLFATPWIERADAATRRLLETAATTLSRAGARVADFDVGGAFEGLEDANRVVSGYEFARTLAHERRVDSDRLSRALREGRMADGLRVDHAAYAQARERLEWARGQLHSALSEVDFVMTPAAPGTAPQGLHATGSAEFNMAWTTLHVPAITLPVGTGDAGLPLGLQLVARRYADDPLLAFAESVFTRLVD
jgi:Asp-tRNA(Asn)/Glu-tRNA(Gln) amidotransferase A subunit family amidase